MVTQMVVQAGMLSGDRSGPLLTVLGGTIVVGKWLIGGERKCINIEIRFKEASKQHSNITLNEDACP